MVFNFLARYLIIQGAEGIAIDNHKISHEKGNHTRAHRGVFFSPHRKQLYSFLFTYCKRNTFDTISLFLRLQVFKKILFFVFCDPSVTLFLRQCALGDWPRQTHLREGHQQRKCSYWLISPFIRIKIITTTGHHNDGSRGISAYVNAPKRICATRTLLINRTS